jgi:long-chain fatty acid transport protein
MNKSLIILMVIGIYSSNLWSQNSILRYKTDNRNATESMDAAVYNPAGMLWLKDGIHIEIGNQLGFGGKEVYDGTTGETFGGKGGSAFDPTAFIVYKKNKWAANFAFGASGGGGGSYPDGSPMITMAGNEIANQLASEVNQGLKDAGLPFSSLINQFTESLYAPNNGSLQEGALDLGFMANAAYKATDWLTFSVGARYLYRTSDYMRGSVALTTDQQAIDDFATTLSSLLPAATIDEIVSQIPVINGDAANMDISYENNNYWKFSVGANIRPTKKLLIAQTLYFGPSYTVNLKVNKIYVDPSLPEDEIVAGFEDLLGMNLEDGAPEERSHNLSYKLGVAYHINDKLRLEANLNPIFKKGSAVNEFSYGLGAEYQLTEKVNWGIGFLYSPVRRDVDAMDDISYKNDFLWLASGIDFKITDRFSGVVTGELGVPTSERVYYLQDGSIEKSYTDNLAISATFGILYSF